jgi:predicted nucleic acid-binding protein
VVRDHLWKLHRQGHVFRVTIPILCETLTGIVRSRVVADRRRRLRQVLRTARIWPIEMDVAERYAEIYYELRDQGRVLSQVDMMIAAVARERNAVILTSDRDFEALPDIRTEDWLAESS